MKWETLRRRQKDQRRKMLHATLIKCDWRADVTADELGVSKGSIRSMIESHGLGELYRSRNPGPGRPR